MDVTVYDNESALELSKKTRLRFQSEPDFKAKVNRVVDMVMSAYPLRADSTSVLIGVAMTMHLHEFPADANGVQALEPDDPQVKSIEIIATMKAMGLAALLEEAVSAEFDGTEKQ